MIAFECIRDRRLLACLAALYCEIILAAFLIMCNAAEYFFGDRERLNEKFSPSRFAPVSRGEEIRFDGAIPATGIGRRQHGRTSCFPS